MQGVEEEEEEEQEEEQEGDEGRRRRGLGRGKVRSKRITEIQSTIKMDKTVPLERLSERASQRMSALERSCEASNVEQVNK